MNTANVWGSIALLILVVYHRVQTVECALILTSRQPFLYTTGDDLAGPIPAPHITRFVVRSNRYSQYGRSAIGAEKSILIPRTNYSLGESIVLRLHFLFESVESVVG